MLIQVVGVVGECWRPQVDALKQHCQTLLFDNRGIGKSIPCPGPITIEAMAEELAGIPTLVLSAEHDPIAPPYYGRALAKSIPGAEFQLLQGTSHGVTIQAADQISAILLHRVAGASVGSSLPRENALSSYLIR